jgi:hypothetical protein
MIAAICSYMVAVVNRCPRTCLSRTFSASRRRRSASARYHAARCCFVSTGGQWNGAGPWPLLRSVAVTSQWIAANEACGGLGNVLPGCSGKLSPIPVAISTGSRSRSAAAGPCHCRHFRAVFWTSSSLVIVVSKIIVAFVTLTTPGLSSRFARLQKIDPRRGRLPGSSGHVKPSVRCQNGGCEYYVLEVKTPVCRSDTSRPAKSTSQLPGSVLQKYVIPNPAEQHS